MSACVAAGCVAERPLHDDYAYYQPQPQEGAAAGLRFSQREATLDVELPASGSTFSVTVDRPEGGNNLIRPVDAAVPFLYGPSVSMRLWVALKCAVPRDGLLYPARVKLHRRVLGRRESLGLRRYLGYRPSALHPTGVDERTVVAPIDMAEGLHCGEDGVAAFSASFVVAPGVEQRLFVSCEGCLRDRDGAEVSLPEIRLDLKKEKRRVGIREQPLLPFTFSF